MSFWNGVDMRYKLLKGPKIRISIAGIIISRVTNFAQTILSSIFLPFLFSNLKWQTIEMKVIFDISFIFISSISLLFFLFKKQGRDATPYLERNRVGRDAIDSAAALTDMGKYLFRERRLPVYDIAVAVTK